MRLVLVVLSVAAGWLSVATVRAAPGFSLAGSEASGTTALLGGACALSVAGLLLRGSRGRRMAGILLPAAAVGWLAGEWDNPGSASSWQFSAGLALVAVTPALLTHAVLVFPGGLAGRWERWLVALGYVVTVPLVGLLPATVLDPATAECFGCPRNWWLVHADAGLALSLARWGFGLATAWAVIALGTLVARLMASSAPRRRVAQWVELVGGAYLLVASAEFFRGAHQGFAGSAQDDRLLWLAAAALQVALAGAFALDRVRTARLRHRLAGLVLDLDRAGPAGDIDAALARMLGVGSMTVAYPTSTAGLYVDLQGRPVQGNGDRPARSTAIIHGGKQLAVVSFVDDPFADPELLARSLHLSLENAGLRAQTAYQLRELQASRARIVEAGDDERRRLEQDLHDGAQQRLVSLLFSLRMMGSGSDSRGLEEAIRHLQSAIDELRRLAHGLSPVLLYDQGLLAALHSLAERAPLRLRGVGAERLPAVLETTIYQLVARVLDAGPAQVAERRDPGWVEWTVTAAGGTSLGDTSDRVAALGGTLTHTVEGGTSRLVIRLPLTPP